MRRFSSVGENDGVPAIYSSCVLQCSLNSCRVCCQPAIYSFFWFFEVLDFCVAFCIAGKFVCGTDFPDFLNMRGGEHRIAGHRLLKPPLHSCAVDEHTFKRSCADNEHPCKEAEWQELWT